MTIRAPAFLTRSRPSSPAPNRPDGDFDSAPATAPARRPITRLQNPFKRSSSASPAPSNRTPFPGTLTPLNNEQPALVTQLPAGLGAHYLDALGLKFAEAASKALANPTGPVATNGLHGSLHALGSAPATVASDPCALLLKGRRPFPSGRGAALGALITSELKRSADVHLSRAIIRTMQRPLSVLLNNLSTMLMPILPYVTSNSAPSDSGSPAAQVGASGPVSLTAQSHALGIAGLAAELLEALNSPEVSAVHVNSAGGGVDTMRGIRDGLEVIVKRVITPLIASVKLEIGPAIDALAMPTSAADGSASTALVTLSAALLSAVPRLACYTSLPGAVPQSAHATLLIGLVWRALVALSSRPLADPFTVPASPVPIKKPNSRDALAKDSKDGKENKTGISSPALMTKKDLPFVSGAGGVTPPRTPPATPRSFSSRLPLPLTSMSRPPSPTGSSANLKATKGSQHVMAPLSPLQQLLADATTVQGMLGTLGKPPQGGLALEAVDEAFDALEGFRATLVWLVEEYVAPRGDGSATKAKTLQELSEALLEKSEDVPALISLNVFIQLVPPAQLPRPTSSAASSSVSLKEWRALSVPQLLGLGLGETEYRAGCLAGFGRAEAAVEPVGRAVLDALARARSPSPSSPSNIVDKGLDVRVLRNWLAERIVADSDDDSIVTLDDQLAPPSAPSLSAISRSSFGSSSGGGSGSGRFLA